MSRKLIFLGLLSLILAPGAALSLGLGDIRLNSYLNQPMNAEIALSLASRGELDSLRVELAPAEAFGRYGLDRPAFLDDLRFQVRPTGAASAVVQVTSSRPIVEPFITFLVEARWSGGRILREYTVLLDPPVFLPRPEAAPVAAPAPSGAPVVEQPRPAPEPAPVGRPAPIAPAVAPPVRSEVGDEFGPVRRNDTLWSIAQRVRPDPSLTTNQVMVALFRANPGAFDGNINRLRAGAILRVPSRDQFIATSVAEANAEVRRHNDDWRAPAAAAAPTERRLELAPPTEAPRPTAPAADPAAPTASRELLDAVQDLRGELAETRRLMDIKDAEIAALQARLAELESDGVAVAPAPAVETPAPAVAEPLAETPAPAEPPPVVAPTAAPAVVSPAPPPPSLVDRVLGLLGSLWLWLVIALVLVAGAVFVFLRKRKEDEERSIEDDLAATGRWSTLESSDGKATVAAAVAAAAAPAAAAAEARRVAREEGSSILVEETRREPAQRDVPPAPPPAPVTPPRPAESDEDDYRYPFEDTIAGEAGINLDQTDPLAEADFHMAYGLYDQAAEIVKKAIEREPDRYDLRRKLVDICFVWGNAREFLAQANAIREMPGEAPSGDWAKIAIMGRQICPGEPLFAGGEVAAVDVELGEDLAEGPAADIGASGSWLDFDVGESETPLEALGDTREQPGLDSPAPVRGAMTEELDLEELGIDLDLGESGEHALMDLADFAPETAPESGLDAPEDWLPEPADEIDEEADETHTGTLRLDTPPVITGLPREPVEEPAPDGGTQMMDVRQFTRKSDDPTERGEGFALGEDEPTLAGIEGYEEEEDSDLTQVKAFSPPAADVDTLEEELDLDLDDLTQMLEADTGARTEDYDVTRIGTSVSEMPFSTADDVETREVPPIEMNEVGTKLDLARAYIDMGDPDGARSILEEVVAEGDEAQRDEARQLLESLS